MQNTEWSMGVTILSAIMLIVLLIIYLRNYKSIKSKFCTGLIIFAVLLLLYNIGMLYFQTMVTEHCTLAVTGPILALNIIETLGLGALLYVTWKPCM